MSGSHPSRSTAAVVTAALAASCVASPAERDPSPTGAAAPLSYVALGDSLAAGTNGVASYVRRYADHLRRESGAEVAVTNLARGGMRSAELLSLLRRDERVRSSVAGADLVTWNIGGNDLAAALGSFRAGECGEILACLDAALDDVRRSWLAIVDEIAGIRRDARGAVRTMNDYNPFVAFLRATGRLALVTDRASELARFKCDAARASGFECADVYTAFNGSDGERDPVAAGLVRRGDVHPTARGQQAMAAALIALGEPAASAGATAGT